MDLFFDEIWGETLLEFEADGQQVEDDTENEEFTMDDEDAAPETQDQQPEDAPAEDAPDDQEFDIQDDETGNEQEETTPEEDNQNQEEPQDDAPEDNAEEDENFDLPDDEGAEGGEADPDGAPPDDAGDEEFDMDNADDAGTGGDIGGNDAGTTDTGTAADQGTLDPKLKDLESVIFDDLSENEKKMKIIELKDAFISVYMKCGSILEIITDIKRDEETIQIVEYISNTLIDLKHYVNDYITNVFDYKTYVENLSQLQKYIMIFNAINKVFDQIKLENNE